MKFSFIHTADLHLDRAFSDVVQIPEKYNNAVFRAFQNLVNFAIEKDVDFILIAGDTFDSENPDFRAKSEFKKYMEKLANANIKVFMICGNHDPLNSYSKRTFNYDNNSNIKITGLNTPTEKEDFIVNNKENIPCAIIHALSFKTKEFTENPATYFKPANIEDKKLFNAGLLHCDLNGSKDSPYAPCSVSDLKELNYDYWALGHIHIPPASEENIFYSGTIQGRNSKESGAFGFRYITVENGIIKHNEFKESDIVRYLNTDIDISHLHDTTEIENEINTNLNKIFENEKFYFIKITLTGDTEFYDETVKDDFKILNTIKDSVNEEYNSKLYISEIINKTVPKVDIRTLKSDTGIIGSIMEEIENEDNLKELMTNLEKKYLSEIKNNFEISNDEYNNIKEYVENEAKQICINICNNLYNND